MAPQNFTHHNMGLVLMKILPPINVRTVVTCLLWYLVSSITSQLTKLILTKFTYPLFLSLCQFFIGTTLALTFIKIVRTFPVSVQHFPTGSVPLETTGPIFRVAVLAKILPLGLFQFVGKFFSLSATSLIPLATVSSIKALSPLLIVLGYRVVYNVKFPFVTYLSLVPLVGGVMLIIASDSMKNLSSETDLLTDENNHLDNKKTKGLAFCILSTLIFATQNIYGKQLMTWDTGNTNNPASLVLNTDPSRSGTPNIFKETDESTPYKSAQIRQRAYSRLPYSTSDLRLDEKSEEFNLQLVSYNLSVNQTNNTVRSPIAYFKDKFNIENVSKPDKLNIILYCSLIGVTFSFWGFLLNELPSIISLYMSDVASDKSTLETTSDVIIVLVLIFLDSLSHFLQTILAFHLLGLIPALSYSVASMMKRIVLITVSIILSIGSTPSEIDAHKWFGKITNEQLCGLFMIAIGLYCYDRWGSKSLRDNRT